VLLQAAAVAAQALPTQPREDQEGRNATSEVTMERTTVLSSARLAAKRGSGQRIVRLRRRERVPAARECARTANSVGNGTRSPRSSSDVARTEIGFDSENNEVTIVTADGDRAVHSPGKPEIAREVLAHGVRTAQSPAVVASLFLTIRGSDVRAVRPLQERHAPLEGGRTSHAATVPLSRVPPSLIRTRTRLRGLRPGALRRSSQ